jgi:hypothetical protein
VAVDQDALVERKGITASATLPSSSRAPSIGNDQTRTVRSKLAVTTRVPSELNAAVSTEA